MDNKNVVVDLRTSDHSVNGNASDKTLMLSEDDSSTRDARNVTKDNAE